MDFLQFSTNTWTFLFITVTFMTYLYIGWRSRVKETEGFYVAGRGVPAIANGAATAADWMSAASFIGMAGLISVLGSDGSVYLMGWTGGYVLLALLLAPYLRKFGEYTVPDFVGKRYYSETARIVAAICAIVVSLTYVAGQMRGVGIVFGRFLAIPIEAGVIVGMIIVAFFAVLGGMKGITWTQVVQFFVLILAFVIPAVAISSMLNDGQWIPQLSIVNGTIPEKIDQIQSDLGFAEYTKPFSGSFNQLNVFLIVFALMVGTAGLPHVIVRFYTTPDVRSARYSAGWALLFIAILYTTAPAVGMFTRYNMLQSLHGKTFEEVEKLEWVKRWKETEGLLIFADKDTPEQPKDGILTIAPGEAFLKDPETGKINPEKPAPNPDTTNELYFDKDIVVLASPEVANLSGWIIGLVAAGGLAAALSTAAGLLLVISSSIAHDLYIHFIDPEASEQKRVKVGRIMIIVAIIFAGYLGIYPPGFVAEVVAFAFGLAAASFFPAILLGIFDLRTNRQGAVLGMIVGLLVTGGYIVACTSNKIIPGVSEPWLDWKSTTGINPQGFGAIGCALNFIITIVVSRLTSPPPEEIVQFVKNVRVPKEAQHLDYDI